jgi:tetratricopeptide (TPR) repeat protein
MAPEQLSGAVTDARSDQFSFCLVLYEALTGTRPFVGDNLEELLSAMRRGRNIASEAKIPSWLRPIIARGLSAEPGERFASMSDLLRQLERDPAVRRQRWLAVASVPLLIALGAFAHQQSRHHPLACTGAEARLVGVWDGLRRERIHAAFLGTQVPFSSDAFSGTARALDQYAQRWLGIHNEVCQATRVRGDQSEELLDLRMSCLEQRRGELKALTELLSVATPSTVEHAVQAAYALGDIAPCANATAQNGPPPPRDATTRARIEPVRARLAEAAARNDAGQYAAGVRLSEAVLHEARDLGYAPVAAEALLLHGQLQLHAGDNKAAESSLREAATMALAAGHDRVAAEASIALGSTIGFWSCRREEGESDARVGSALVERLGSDDKLRVYAARTLGSIMLWEGRLDEALAFQTRAVALAEKSEPDSPQLAAAVHDLANAYYDLWRYEDQLAADQRSLQLWTKTLGPAHPNVTAALTGMGLALFHMGRFDEALAQHRRALEISERALGPMHPMVGVACVNMADMYLSRHEYDKALRLYQRGLAVWEKSLGADSPWLVSALEGIGGLELERGHAKQALVPLERSRTIRKALNSNIEWEVAALELMLARAHWQSHGDKAHAIYFAQAARAIYATAPRYQAQLAATDAWLRTHRQ